MSEQDYRMIAVAALVFAALAVWYLLAIMGEPESKWLICGQMHLCTDWAISGR